MATLSEFFVRLRDQGRVPFLTHSHARTHTHILFRCRSKVVDSREKQLIVSNSARSPATSVRACSVLSVVTKKEKCMSHFLLRNFFSDISLRNILEIDRAKPVGPVTRNTTNFLEYPLKVGVYISYCRYH